MMLVRRQPSADGNERRFFECPNCDEVVRFLVAPDDPLDKVGDWLASDLKPPT